jgi:hypothetical protein
MKYLIITIVIVSISISTAYAQSLKSISNNQDNRLILADKPSSINLKLNYYFHFPDSYTTEYGYGFLGEYQLMTSKKFGWLFSANVLSLIKKDHDGIQYTKFGGLVLTFGSKLYFNNSNLQGYSSLGIGAGIGGGDAAFAITPALGIEYKISSGIKLNLETKSNIYISFAPVLSQFINAGIIIIL